MSQDVRKPIFDAARTAKGAGFTQEQVDEMNATFDHVGIPKTDPGPEPAPAPSPAPAGGLTVSPQGETQIGNEEGCAKLRSDGRYDAYPDPGSKDGTPWTIGHGSTGAGIAKGTIWTRQQCDDRFAADITKFSAQVVDALAGAPTTQTQFDALVSLAYNIGIGAFKTSTLLSLHKAKNYGTYTPGPKDSKGNVTAGPGTGAAGQFAAWRNNDGNVMQGLVNRRDREANLYANGVYAT